MNNLLYSINLFVRRYYINKFTAWILFLLLGLCRIAGADPWPIDTTNHVKNPRIVLMLPLYGPYAQSGKAIRDGFLAAYYQTPNNLNTPTLRIVDTSGDQVVSLYKQAVADGADFVVGPLNKEDGTALIHAGLTVPTLLLNTLPLTGPISNLYQFGLSPEDEARQVADKAWHDGHKNILIIAPDQDWGHRTASAFLAAWQAYGGQSLGEMYYDSSVKMAPQIAKLLQIDRSTERAKNLQHMIAQPNMRSTLYRRQDIDMIFLVAMPEMARQIRPLINFYYAGNIPIYATSHIYSGIPNPGLDQDLNGILFCAIPWEISSQSLSPDLQAIRQQVKTYWPKNYAQNPQLFALGADSYRLALLLLANHTPGQTYEGATGRLTLSPNQVWVRDLPWAQMTNAQPVLLPH